MIEGVIAVVDHVVYLLVVQVLIYELLLLHLLRLSLLFLFLFMFKLYLLVLLFLFIRLLCLFTSTSLHILRFSLIRIMWGFHMMPLNNILLQSLFFFHKVKMAIYLFMLVVLAKTSVLIGRRALLIDALLRVVIFLLLDSWVYLRILFVLMLFIEKVLPFFIEPIGVRLMNFLNLRNISVL